MLFHTSLLTQSTILNRSRHRSQIWAYIFLAPHCIKLDVRKYISVLFVSLTGFVILRSHLPSVSLSLLICQMMEMDKIIIKSLLLYSVFEIHFATFWKTVFESLILMCILLHTFWCRNYFTHFVILTYILLSEIFRDYVRQTYYKYH